MINQFLFSICVPVYNVEKYLRQCIESILNQSYGSFELILVDDGSSDGSYQICKECQSKDARIKAFTKENGGQISAREYAFERAKGDIILCVDSDDYIERRTLEVLKSYFEKENPDCVYFNWQRVCDGKIINSQKVIDKQIKIDGLKAIFKTICSNAYYNSMCLKAFKKELLPKTKLKDFYRFRHGEDLVQTLMILDSVKTVLFVPDVLYNYRVNLNSISHNVSISMYESRFFVSSYVYFYLKEKGFFTSMDWNDYGVSSAEKLYTNIYEISGVKASLREKTNCFDGIRKSQFFTTFLYDKWTKNFFKNIVLMLLKMKMNFLLVLMCLLFKKAKDLKNFRAALL